MCVALVRQSTLGNVLLVDDDAAVRSAIKFSLEAEGFRVRTFSSSDGLLAEVEPEERTCLVLDYRMPWTDGLQLFEQLRERGWNTPAILITGRANPQLRLRAERLGFYSVLEKPLSDGTLLRDIRAVLST